QTGIQSGNLAPYTQFETSIFFQVGAWAALIYTFSAWAWTWCFARSTIWQRWLIWLSAVTWLLLMAVSIGPLLPDAVRPGAGIIAAGNAIGFALMMVWFSVIAELVLRRSRPDEPFGRVARWVHPRRDLLGKLLTGLGASRLARAFGEWLPPVAFMSNITNVIYVNYLVEAQRLIPLVPWALELQRLGPEGKYALFTHLTYQHGHFGPQL